MVTKRDVETLLKMYGRLDTKSGNWSNENITESIFRGGSLICALSDVYGPRKIYLESPSWQELNPKSEVEDKIALAYVEAKKALRMRLNELTGIRMCMFNGEKFKEPRYVN